MNWITENLKPNSSKGFRGRNGSGVGHDGYIVIASRKDGTILNHPDKRMVGKTMCLLTNDPKVVPLHTESAFSVTSIEELSASAVPDTVYIEPYVMGPASDGINAGTVFTNMIVGCVLSYQDVYIICGIGSMEILMYIFMGQMGTCILFAILWVFVRYAVMLISRHEHSGKTLRSRLHDPYCHLHRNTAENAGNTCFAAGDQAHAGAIQY